MTDDDAVIRRLSDWATRAAAHTPIGADMREALIILDRVRAERDGLARRREATDAAEPSAAYRKGWRDALSAAGKCAAYNDGRPPPTYALCVKQRDHTGKHDDWWMPWGDRDATAEANRAEAEAHRLAEEPPNA